MARKQLKYLRKKYSQIVQKVLFLGSFILFILIIANSIKIRAMGEDLFDIGQEVQNATDDAFTFITASDYLTEEAHYFVTLGDIKNLYNYFHEVNAVQRREKTIQRISEYSISVNSEILSTIMNISKELENREIYSFKLFSQIFELDENVLPDAVKNFPLEAGDETLDRKAKYEKARELIFSQYYQHKKIEMREYVFSFYNGLSKNLLEKYLYYSNIVKIKNYRLVVYTISLFGTLLIFFIVSGVLHSEKIVLMKKNRTDPLTGVQNRGAFEKVCLELSQSDNPLAFVMIDADHFKSINDKFGHDAGDKVLKLITKTISNHFRDADIIFRIGGDEFVMLLDNWDEGSKNVLMTKFEIINRELRDNHEGIPEISISVGIAFSTMGMTASLQKHADTALYAAKEAGRGCARIFDDKVM